MLELHPRQAFNASMEHSNEKQHPDDTPAYEACIQDIYLASQTTRDILDKIKQFQDRTIDPVSEEGQILGRITKGTLDVSRDAIDDDDFPAAGKMFLSGAMAGLYVGDEMMGGEVPVKQVLTASYELIKHDPRQFMHDAATTVEKMDPTTVHIVNKWKQAVGGNNAGDVFFDIGFGIMMCSVNKTIYEIDMIHNLERSVDWELPEKEKPSPVALQSIDEDCLRLGLAFRDHADAIGFDKLPKEDRQAGLVKIARSLENDLAAIDTIRKGDHVQTRGMGMCATFDEQDKPDDVCEFDDDLKVRGVIVRVDCMPMPTEFAVLMNITEGDDISEPQVCLILESVELVEPSGEIMVHEGAIAIPLRASGTTQLDKIIYQAE